MAIAHGYAKVTGRPMAAAVHSNVGLMHATMAIFNAWCDRMPVLVLGATGPVDAPKRRPWIDWIHTARDQGALIRAYTKWDDQPASAEAAREAVLRAFWLARSAPMAPVYVNLDAGMQEAPLADPLPPLDISRFVPDVAAGAPPEAGGPGSGDAAAGEAAGDPDGTRFAQRAGMGQSRRTGRSVARARGDRFEDAARCSRPTIRCMPARRRRFRCRRRRRRSPRRMSS